MARRLARWFYMLPEDKRGKAQRRCDNWRKSASHDWNKAWPVMIRICFCTRAKSTRRQVELNDWLERQAQAHLSLGKTVGVLGGDHSVPLGLIRALATRYESFGVLRVMRMRICDADTKASSIRTHRSWKTCCICHMSASSRRSESAITATKKKRRFVAGDRVSFFPMRSAQTEFPWRAVGPAPVSNIVDTLPQQVYVSFDIDGLDPALCPETGTPVPGGLTWDEAVFLLDMVVGQRTTGDWL